MALTPAQRETAKSLFEAALACQAETRSVFVKENCHDRGVRQEVERLLVNYSEMGSFLGEAEPASTGPSSAQTVVPTLSEGETLANRFTITRFIAHGGMGEVYEAEDLELRELVALKVIRPSLVHPQTLKQFKKEVQLAKKVTHRNVCRIYDLFRHPSVGREGKVDCEDILIISMELLIGETLAERLRGGVRLTPAETLPIIEQIADGLDAAHAAGVLHRDLKPENVIWCRRAHKTHRYERSLRILVSP